jgi:hypothetical protein
MRERIRQLEDGNAKASKRVADLNIELFSAFNGLLVHIDGCPSAVTGKTDIRRRRRRRDICADCCRPPNARYLQRRHRQVGHALHL